MSRPQRDGPSRPALKALLAFLGENADAAADAYLRLRQRLVKVLEIRSAAYRLRAAPEDLADETIERVARQLEEGLEIRSQDPLSYFCGVARYVVQETARAEQRAGTSLEENRDWPQAPDPEPPDPTGERLRSLEACLDELVRKDRDLILGFYGGDRGSSRIRHRKRLARTLGMSPNALRIRAFRLRRLLEPCIDRRLRESQGGP